MSGGVIGKIEKIIDEISIGLYHSNGSYLENKDLEKCVINHSDLELCIITALNVGDKRSVKKYVDLMVKLEYLYSTPKSFGKYFLSIKTISFIKRIRKNNQEFSEEMKNTDFYEKISKNSIRGDDD